MEKKKLAPSRPPTVLSATRIEEINQLHKKFTGSMKKAAGFAFKTGELLHEIYLQLPPEISWPEYVNDTFIFSIRTANTYIRLYEGFRDAPKQLEEKTITAALEYLGKKPAEKAAGRVEYGGSPDSQPELDWEEIFSKPTVSKAKLQNYRFECPDKRTLWLVKRGFNYPIKFMELLAEPPKDDLKLPHDSMLKTIQGAVELYFEQVEKTEKTEDET